jgi:glycogen(starch) synthase
VNSTSILQLGVGWFPEQAGNGLDRMFYGLAHHLPEVGVGVRGLVVGTEGVRIASDDRVRAVARESEALLRRLWAFRREAENVLERARIDLVATHFALYTLPVLDRLSSRPLVVHFHGPWAAESAAEGEHPLVARVKATIERMVYARGDRFVVLSEAFAELLHSSYGVPRASIRVVPGGVDVERFDTGMTREQARERLGWPTDRPIVVSVRRLVRRVGLEQLVDAFQTVRRRVPDALLFIGGKGPLESELAARIRSSGLEDHVQLLGFVPEDDLPLAYRAADVSVVPTQALEGFGLIAAESLAAGTPVIVTPVGGLPEVVRDLSKALVLPDCSAGALADRLIDELVGEARLPSSSECQAYARSHFAWGRIAQQVRAVYEEVL